MDTGAAIILAGGEGTRLRALTRRLVGDDRPKQFCPVIGDETLLEQSRARAGRLTAPAHTLIVVTRAHEQYYAPALVDVPPRHVVVQPANRGTAPAVLYALARLASVAAHRPVVLLPSDHYVADDAAFMARVQCAFESVVSHRGRVVLLGVDPDRPETSYGWIEPGDLLLERSSWPIYRVRGFHEKPPRATAEALMRAGALWNSFVIVADAGTLLTLIARTLPVVSACFASLRAHIDTPWENAAATAVYAALPSADLSRDVLQRAGDHLAVLPVTGVDWTDLGEPERALAARRRRASRLVAV